MPTYLVFMTLLTGYLLLLALSRRARTIENSYREGVRAAISAYFVWLTILLIALLWTFVMLFTEIIK